MEAILRNYFGIEGVSFQALAYATAGMVGTAAHFAVLIVLLQGLLSDVVIASTLGAIIGALVNYALAHRKVFKSQLQHRVALPKFAVVASIGVGINAAVLAAIAKPLGPLAGQLLASGAVLSSGFILNRIWSFRE